MSDLTPGSARPVHRGQERFVAPTEETPLRDIDVVDAYENQLLGIRRRVADGARVIGHKVGLSSEAMQKMMNVDEPDYGHLLDEMQYFESTPIDRSKLNVNGSSLAAGHPFAATGGRIIAQLAKQLHEKGSGRGLISVCAAGGQGVVAILEAV